MFYFICRTFYLYDSSKFEKKRIFHKIGNCTHFLHRNFALKSWFKFKKSLNLKKQERNGVSKTCFILSVRHFVAKIWLRRFWADLGKNAFSHSWQLYTVTQDEYELRKAAHMFGWLWGVEGGPAYVGWPRIKRSLFFLKLFLESQNHREKLISWGRNWVHWKDNFLKKD
jgi:hypothetical protein